MPERVAGPSEQSPTSAQKIGGAEYESIVARVNAKYEALLAAIDRQAEAEQPAVLERVEQIKKRGRQRAYIAHLEARRRSTKTTHHNQEAH